VGNDELEGIWQEVMTTFCALKRNGPALSHEKRYELEL
jgi:hypothetical protein